MHNIIVCTLSESKNPLIQFFSAEWIKAMKKIPEIHVKEVVVDEILESSKEIDDEFMEMLKSPECSMLCYNNCGIPLYNEENQNIWEIFGVQVYDFLLDHPRNYELHLKNPVKNLHVICLDRDHEEFVKKFYPEVEEAVFLPDGGVNICDKPVPLWERNKDVIYCGNCQYDPEEYVMVEYLPNHGVDMYARAIEYIFNEPSLTAEAAVERYLSENDLKKDKDILYDLFITKKVTRYIEDIVRREYKLMIMHALDAAGVTVDIYGGGWEDHEKPFSDNIRIHERVSPFECHSLIGDTKIDLSIMPWFKRGSSEKPFSGMLNGAVCVSDTSTYLEENYLDGIDIMLFDLEHIEKAVEDILWLLNNPEEAEIIAQNGFRHAKEHDSTDIRVRQILNIMYRTYDGLRNKSVTKPPYS